MNLIEIIKQKVRITDIYPYSLRNNRGVCEIKGENTSSPSFLYYSHDDSWCCFSCGTGGDVINLYAHIHNLSYRDALYELTKQYHIKIEEKDEIYYQQIDQIKEGFKKFSNICHINLKKNTTFYNSIKENRGFIDEIIEEYQIGLFDHKIKAWLEKNYDFETLISMGFLNEKGNWYFDKRIVFNYLDSKNEPCYFIYRLIDSEPDFMKDAKYIKHHKTDYIKEELFGIDSLSKFQNKPLIITEGITDAMSVIQYEYPCVSPVTIRFKEEDIIKIIQYAKRYDKIIVINDNEEDQKGLEGAEKTLRTLLSFNLPIYISIIPNPLNLKKIDLNDYLKQNGDKGFQYLLNNCIEGFEYFISLFSEKSTQEDIEEIIKLIPKDQVLKRKEIFKQIKLKTKITVKTLEDIYKKALKKEEEKKKEEARKKKEVKRESMEGVLEAFKFQRYGIEIREDGIWRISVKEDMFYEEQILDGYFELIHKTKYLGHDYFSYKFRDNIFNTQTNTLILLELRNYIYGGDSGKDIVKKIINFKGEELEYKECRTTLGFDNGWILPFLEDKYDYKVLVYTDIQRRVFQNCRTIIKEYSADDKKKIIESLKRFIEITQIKKPKLATIIAWAIASVFKLPLLHYFKLFPGLLLQGDKQSGKTYCASFFVIDFFGVWKNYLSGASIKTEARCEDFLSTSTFPIHLDELEYVKYAIIEILKSTLTGIHDYVRKIGVLEEISKPEITPFCITTNEAPKPFLDPALNSKMIILNFSAEEVIKDDYEWMNLYNELKQEKLFSFLYEYTLTWKNKDVIEYIKEIENELEIKEGELTQEDSEETFNSNSRLKKKYIILLFGLRLFKDIFGIDITSWLDKELLGSSERIISENLLDQFLEFCTKAIEFDYGYDDDHGHHRGDNPKYITCELMRNGDFYVFKQDNLRDFNEFSKEKYTMRNLGNLLNDGIENKEMIKYGRFYLSNIQYRSIGIHKDMFNNIIKKEVQVKIIESDRKDKIDYSNVERYDVK